MRVLIVEDDTDTRLLLNQLLNADGYEVATACDGRTAAAAVAAHEPDLVLLDVVLGDEDGREVLQESRRVSDVPVVFLTGRGLEMDRIAGLKMGADDYVVKPFSRGELSARIASVLRRSRPGDGKHPGAVQFHDLKIDPVTREVRVRGALVELTAKEFDLLLFLASSPGQVFSASRSSARCGRRPAIGRTRQRSPSMSAGCAGRSRSTPTIRRGSRRFGVWGTGSSPMLMLVEDRPHLRR